jgi:hypothetical protein
MRITLAVVRIYGTNDQYGDVPRTRPAGAPIVFAGFPDADMSARIDFGPVPDDIADAERSRRGLGRVMLGGLFGGEYAGLGPNEKLDAALAEMGDVPLFEELNWYATLALEKELDVADDEFKDDLDVVFPLNAFQLAKEAVAKAKDGLDILVSVAASVVDPRVFSNVVLEDRVLLFAHGKRATGVPVLTAGGSGLVIRAGEETLQNLATRLDLFGGFDPASAARMSWFALTAHWHVQVMRENDPWKRFLWSFVGLEILTHKLYAHFRDDVVRRLRLDGVAEEAAAELPLPDLVWTADRAPLATRFALVATALFPSTASDDAAAFRRLKAARDDLAHGSLREEDAVPAGEATELFGKYLGGAMKRLVFGLDASADWDARPSDTSASDRD